MYKHLGYAIYKNNDTIWEIVSDNEDGTLDISIDDIQGDIAVCCVSKLELVLVDKKEYKQRIKKLNNFK